MDDVVVEWREFSLVDDATDCATGGSCATIEVGATNVFSGSTILTITVLDSFPHGPQGVDLDDGTGGPCRNDVRPQWAVPKSFTAFSGALEAVGGYFGAILETGGAASTSFRDARVPSAGSGVYYLAREGEFCNAAGLWTGGGDGEDPGRETSLP